MLFSLTIAQFVPSTWSACGASTPATPTRPIGVSKSTFDLQLVWYSLSKIQQKVNVSSFLVFWHDDVTVDGQDYTNVQVQIDSDYACGIFQSCAKESYIA